jgi:hypothetical protein
MCRFRCSSDAKSGGNVIYGGLRVVDASRIAGGYCSSSDRSRRRRRQLEPPGDPPAGTRRPAQSARTATRTVCSSAICTSQRSVIVEDESACGRGSTPPTSSSGFVWSGRKARHRQVARSPCRSRSGAAVRLGALPARRGAQTVGSLEPRAWTAAAHRGRPARQYVTGVPASVPDGAVAPAVPGGEHVDVVLERCVRSSQCRRS